MVLPNRTLDNGLGGYSSATTIPKARRSIRRRGSCQKTLEGGQICAFDLLATVAEKLLEESNECSSASSSVALRFDRCGITKGAIKKEIQDSSEGSIFFSSLQRDISRGKLETVSEKIEEHAPPLSGSEYSVKVDSDATNLEKGINGKLDNSGGTKTEENFNLPLCGDSNPNNASFLKKHENCVRNRSKDDEGILSCYSQPNKTMKAYRSPTHFEEPKINQRLTSKCWKAGPKLTDYEPSKMAGVDKHMYHNKRSHCELDRLQRNTPIKKRKLFDRTSVVTCDGGISSESVSNSPVKSIDDEKKAWDVKLHEDNMTSSSECERQESVRLSIKSFKIPELFIDVPETTTIGSLKRTVLEAVTSILSGGLRVGVLVQGKKLKDDNETLRQTSLCQNNGNADAIQFMLEPNRPTQTSNPTYSEDAPVLLSCDSPKFVNRPRVHVNKDMNLLGTLEKPCMTDSNSPTTQSSMEALAVVPVSHRSTRHEIGQRRTRRPFSVTEVEALVHAVEKLGTGRWRDVKLCSFENAKHRTYVDLKDKWKTLVHTARISPQQRRGEPVPQELLDRVLATQTYWSDHQAKHHGKHQQLIIPKLRDSTAVRV